MLDLIGLAFGQEINEVAGILRSAISLPPQRRIRMELGPGEPEGFVAAEGGAVRVFYTNATSVQN